MGKQPKRHYPPGTPKPRANRAKGGGMPPFVPSDEQRSIVRVMVAAGIQQNQIAAALKIERTTLAKHFRDELDNGMVQANAQVVANLFRQTKLNVRAAEFWLTNRDSRRWAHKQRIDGSMDLNVGLADRITRAKKRSRGS